MQDMTGVDLRTDPAARPARKLPVEVQVQFAEQPGRLETLEGPVSYRSGDAIVTGSKGERWPIERQNFLRNYQPLGNGKEGQAGPYRKRPVVVHARQMQEPFAVTIGPKREVLNGTPGDWLLQYGPGEYGIVSATIFAKTYQLLDANSS